MTGRKSGRHRHYGDVCWVCGDGIWRKYIAGMCQRCFNQWYPPQYPSEYDGHRNKDHAGMVEGNDAGAVYPGDAGSNPVAGAEDKAL